MPPRRDRLGRFAPVLPSREQSELPFERMDCTYASWHGITLAEWTKFSEARREELSLIARIQIERDPEDIELVMDIYEGRMMKIAKVHVQQKAEPDDVLADLRVKFRAAILRFRYNPQRKKASLLGLLDTIGRNYNYDLNRRASTRPVETELGTDDHSAEHECRASLESFAAVELVDALSRVGADAMAVALYCAEHPGLPDHHIALALTAAGQLPEAEEFELVAEDAHLWTVARVEAAKSELAAALSVRLPGVMANAKLQLGYESPDNKIRLTPIDQKLALSDGAIAIISVLISAVDASDAQPGDGEIDIPITDQVRAALRKALPVIADHLPGDGNVFFRLKRVA